MIGQSETQSRSDAIQGLEYTGNPFAYDSRMTPSSHFSSDDDKELFEAVMSGETNPEQTETSIDAIRQIGEDIARVRREEIGG